MKKHGYIRVESNNSTTSYQTTVIELTTLNSASLEHYHTLGQKKLTTGWLGFNDRQYCAYTGSINTEKKYTITPK